MEQLKNIFIEKVPAVVDHTVGHYLPHHCVHKDLVITPIRVDINCSVKKKKKKKYHQLRMTILIQSSIYPRNWTMYSFRLKVKIYAYVGDTSVAFL